MHRLRTCATRLRPITASQTAQSLTQQKPAVFNRTLQSIRRYTAPVAAEPFLNGTSSNYVEEMYYAWLENPKSVHKVGEVWDTRTGRQHFHLCPLKPCQSAVVVHPHHVPHSTCTDYHDTSHDTALPRYHLCLKSTHQSDCSGSYSISFYNVYKFSAISSYQHNQINEV